MSSNQNTNKIFNPAPELYDTQSRIAVFAAQRDSKWFAVNSKSVWRVRPLAEGESHLMDHLRRRRGMGRAYVLVIDHKRAKDRRQKLGRGVYPIAANCNDKSTARAAVTAEARRIVKWFKKHKETPPAPPGGMMLVGLS